MNTKPILSTLLTEAEEEYLYFKSNLKKERQRFYVIAIAVIACIVFLSCTILIPLELPITIKRILACTYIISLGVFLYQFNKVEKVKKKVLAHPGKI